MLPVSRQKSRRLRPGFAMFSKGRNSFRSWLRRLKTWNGRRKWMPRITNTSQHRSRRRGSTRPWTRSKMPNISAVQRPSPPVLETKNRNKIALGTGRRRDSLGDSARVVKGSGFEPDRWTPTPARDPVGHSTHAFDPLTRMDSFALPRNGSPANPGPLATRRHHRKLAPWEHGHFIRPYCEPSGPPRSLF